MRKAQIRHYYPDCEGIEVYPSNECKKCKIKRNQEYLKTERGKLAVERSVAKQRLTRKIRQVAKILLDVEKDLDSVDSSVDSMLNHDLEQIQSTMQRLCIQKTTETPQTIIHNA